MMEEIQMFETYLRQEKGASESTVRSYLQDVRKFSSWLRWEGMDLNQVRTVDIQRFAQHLGDLGRSPATIKRAIASLRSYFDYLQRQNKVNFNCVYGATVKKVQRNLPKVLSSKEVERFLDQPKGEDAKSVRDRAMLELLYATGIRVTELVELRVQEVDLTEGYIRFSSKGKMRTVPLYPKAVLALEDYLTNVRPTLVTEPEQDTLFLNRNGKRMSRQGFWKLIKHYQALAGIKGEITPQILRHSFAAHLLKNGADLRFIQEMLGHSDPASTQIYVKVVEKKLKDAYAKAHPRA